MNGVNTALATPSSNPARRALMGAALAGLVLTIVWLSDPAALVERVGVGDFIAYWSAGRALATGGNPYDWQTLLGLQRPLGWSEDFPNMMYYPPWALALVAPFGVLPFPAARLLWLVLNAAIVVACSDWLWRYYGGPPQRRAVAWIIGLVFVPTLIAFQMGQMGAVLLLGIVAFLRFEKNGNDWLAGAVLLLPAIKPQLLYLFGLGVLVWSVHRSRWKIIVGGILALAVATILAAALDPQLLVHYRFALANPPTNNITPTFGAMLRLLFGVEHTWLQYVPTLAGFVWFGFYWRRHAPQWDWSIQTPVLLLMSFMTAAYGAWVFDLVVLLVPIIQVAAWAVQSGDQRVRQAVLICACCVNGVALAMNVAEVTYPVFIWMTPTILVCYLVFRHRFAICESQPC